MAAAGWLREHEVRLTLTAVEHELELAMRAPRRLAGSRLIRLRLLLIAALSTDLPLGDALVSLRDQLRQPPPPLT
jgi:hypothetical protein